MRSFTSDNSKKKEEKSSDEGIDKSEPHTDLYGSRSGGTCISSSANRPSGSVAWPADRLSLIGK